MKVINLFPLIGNFAENKDIARDLRIREIMPSLDKDEEITLDFKGVESATQSFIHALISEIIRSYGIDILDKIYFKDCSGNVKKIINIVTDYMQERD